MTVQIFLNISILTETQIQSELGTLKTKKIAVDLKYALKNAHAK